MRDIKFKEGDDLFNYRVAAIIENKGKYLFQIMPGDECFTLVGGRVRFMETSRDALIREVLEETGYDISRAEIKLSLIAENFFDYKDKNNIVHNVQTLLFVYKVNIDEDIIKEKSFVMKDKDDTTLNWVSYDEVKKAEILPEISKRILDDDSLKYELINDRQFS